MYNANIPADRELPSTKQLIKSTILGAMVAGVLLVTIVMPAEYAIDPTGFGKLTGLQQMGEIRVSLAQEAAQAEAAKLASPAPSALETPVAKATAAPAVTADFVELTTRKHTTTITLAPNEAAEIKAVMKKGQKINYEWTSTGKLNFDNHADSKSLNIEYHGYSKGVGKERDAGVIEAAFEGRHGWFWRNRTKDTVTVTLATNGEYSELVRAD